MFPGVNPRQMKQAMKRMGIAQQEIPADEVIIRTGEKEIVISNPQVSKVNMMGQETFQVVGEISERAVDSTPEISEEDVEMVMSQTSADKETVEEVLKETKGDLAEAIMKLKQE